jgi:hypothetical protein
LSHCTLRFRARHIGGSSGSGLARVAGEIHGLAALHPRAATRLHSGSARRWRVAGAVQMDEARSVPHENIPMAVRPRDTWYVSFEPIKLPTGKRAFSRATKTFRSELEAKDFARQKLAETQMSAPAPQSLSAETCDIGGADRALAGGAQQNGRDALRAPSSHPQTFATGLPRLSTTSNVTFPPSRR